MPQSDTVLPSALPAPPCSTRTACWSCASGRGRRSSPGPRAAPSRLPEKEARAAGPASNSEEQRRSTRPASAFVIVQCTGRQPQRAIQRSAWPRLHSITAPPSVCRSVDMPSAASQQLCYMWSVSLPAWKLIRGSTQQFKGQGGEGRMGTEDCRPPPAARQSACHAAPCRRCCCCDAAAAHCCCRSSLLLPHLLWRGRDFQQARLQGEHARAVH